MEKQEEKPIEHILPVNVFENKTFMGVIKTRNLIEGVIMALFTANAVMRTISMFYVDTEFKIVLTIFSSLIVGAVGVAGKNGDPITTFVRKFIRYHLLKTKAYGPPDENYLSKYDQKVVSEKKGVKKSKKGREKKKKQKEHKSSWAERRNEKKRKDQEEKIKAFLIMQGMDPVQVASMDVLPKDEKKKKKKKIDLEKEEQLIVKKIREYRQSKEVQKSTYIIDGLEMPPVRTTVSDFLPFQALAGSIIKTKDSRYIKIAEVSPTNFHLRPTEDKNQIIRSFYNYLKVAPVTFQIKCIKRKTNAQKHISLNQELTKNEDNQKCIEMQQEFIRLLTYISQNESSESKFYFIFEYATYGVGVKDELNAMNALSDVFQACKETLCDCELNVTDHGEDCNIFVAEMIYEMLNRDAALKISMEERKREVADYYMKTFRNPEFLSRIPISELFASESLDFEESPNYCKVNDRYYAFYYIPGNGYGKSRVVAGWTSVLTNFDEGVDIDFFFEKKDKATMKWKMSLGMKFKMFASVNANNYSAGYEESMTRLESNSYIKQGLEYEDFFYAHALITVSAEDLSQLKAKIKRFKFVCMERDIEIQNCNYIQDKAFLSSLPCCNLDSMIKKPAKRNMLTEGVSSFFPFVSNKLSDVNGILIGMDIIGKEMVLLDLFNTDRFKNANMLIFGTTGAGKTYLLLLMAMRMRMMGIPVFIVAPLKAHEFKRACREIGGAFNTIASSSEMCINIMEIRKRDNTVSLLLDLDTEEISELTEKIDAIKIFCELNKADITEKEKDILDEALVKVYAKKGITHDNDSLFIEGTKKYKEMPILGDLYDELAGIPGAEDLRRSLKKFVYGSAKNFNQQTNVDVENMFSVFDVEHLGKDILAAGMFIVIEFIWTKIKEDRTLKKALFLDELWKMINKNFVAANYVMEIFKTIRAYGGGAIGATQSSNDLKRLEDGKYGKELANCSEVKFVLQLEKDEANNIQDILDLSASEVRRIKRFHRGYCLAMCNGDNIPVRIIASKAEHDLITTERSEQEELVKKKRKELEASA